MATNDMNERLYAQLVGLEADVIANFPPSDRERLIDWPLCRRLNEMIASAQEVEFGLPEQIEENDQYTVAGFLVTINQARRALGCPADEGLQLVEEGLYDDYSVTCPSTLRTADGLVGPPRELWVSSCRDRGAGAGGRWTAVPTLRRRG